MKEYKVEVYENGTRHWYLNDKRHREDGPAIEYSNGDRYWYINGKQHREDGPAIEHADGDKFWYINGKLHREDGPAEEYADGDKFWYINGKELTEEEYNNRNNVEVTLEDIAKVMNIDVDALRIKGMHV